MSWYDSAWPYRVAISVDNSAGTVAAHDIAFSVATDFDKFWDNVQADGDDVRITDSDGRTLTTYQVTSFNSATRTGSFEVDGYSFAAVEVTQLFLYWGNASATSAAGSFVAATPKTGYVEQGRPGPILFDGSPERAGALRPRNVLAKNSSETLMVWVDFRSRLQQRAELFEGRPLLEEIKYMDVDAVSNGAPDSSVYTKADSRFIDQGIVGVELTDGTDGTDYAVRVKAVTTLGRTFLATIWMQVRNTDDV